MKHSDITGLDTINKASESLHHGRLDEAQALVNQVLEQESHHAEALHLQGLIHYRENRLAEARQYFRQAVRANPGVTSFHVNLSNAALDCGDLAEGIQSAESALAIESAYGPARYQYARALFMAGSLEQAKAAIERFPPLQEMLPEARWLLAQIYHSLQDWPRARKEYERCLALQPDNALLRLNLADVLLQQGLLDEALLLYRALSREVPGMAEIWHGLGLCYLRMKDFGQALQSFRQALSLNPALAETHNALGALFQNQGDLHKAQSFYFQAIKKKADYVEAYYNLGNVLRIGGQLEPALAALETALKIKADYLSAALCRAMCFHDKGELASAKEAYRYALSLDVDNVLATHMLAALDGEAKSQPESGFIENLYQDYAVNYDHHLQMVLSFQVPEMIGDLLRDKLGALLPLACVLELGCGSGLTGRVLAELTESLHGVDLAPAMLELAADKQCYQALHQADLLDFLRSGTEQYDLCVAADVFIYCGDLQAIFAGIKARLRPGGCFVFTTEAIPGSAYRLLPSGRYGHGRRYIEVLAEKHGFELVYQGAVSLRKEYGDWVKGGLFLLRC